MNGRTVMHRLLAASVIAFLALALAPAVPVGAASPNPLAGRWGVYTGAWDRTYPAYRHAHGRQKRLFAKVALRPHAAWFANPDLDKLRDNLSEYIRASQHGDPNALVQFALFHQWPRGEGARRTPMTQQEQAAYRTWIDTAVRTIGSTRAMVILEPDLALDAPSGHTIDRGVRLSLVRYAAQRLSTLPRTTVYLEVGAPDWLAVPTATRLLLDAGVGYTRGFAVGGTHHTSVGADVNYATRIVAQLARSGYPDKHAVLDTADNGRPFTYQQAARKYPRSRFHDLGICRTRRERRCVTLGIPPTAHVTGHRRALHLTRRQDARLAAVVDAFVWLGRPWRGNGGSTFAPRRLLQAARTTPFR